MSSVLESKIITKPKVLLLDGLDTVSTAIESLIWLESLQTWALAQQMEPLLVGGLLEYKLKYPLKLSKPEPYKPNLTLQYQNEAAW